jgi:mRNA degradation ribonuclease J1/J2
MGPARWPSATEDSPVSKKASRLAEITMRRSFADAGRRFPVPASWTPLPRHAHKQDDGTAPEVTARLNWHILGGNNRHRIGANCGLCVYEEKQADGTTRRRALLFDAGLLAGDPKAPEDPLLADSDSVIPDLTGYLYKKDDPAHQPETPIDSIYLTHNHADHVGAIPFLLLMGYQVPKIFATPYTAKRLEQELAMAGLPPAEWPPIYTIAPGKPIEEGPVKVTAFWVSHSTPQSAGFFIETPEGNILNPGDFKLDQSVLWGPAFSQAQFDRVVSKPVDLLLMDSTGADRDVTPITEADVRNALADVIRENPGKRVVIAVMSGFEENMASAARVAAEAGRDLWVAGWSHEQALDALRETGMTLQDRIGLPLNVRMLSPGKAARDLAQQAPGASVVIVTGAQGKPNAVLTRTVEGGHNALTLDPEKDIVLFCAPSIPGQEGGRQRLFALLRQKNIPFLTRADRDLYAHAHARLPELKKMAQMAAAATIVPIHGDKTLRDACAAAMRAQGHRVVEAENGEALRVSRKANLTVAHKHDADPRLIGFKTLQGSNWQDRHYMMVKTADRKPPAANDDAAAPPAPKRPRIFDIGK